MLPMIHARIYKIDEATQTVHGRACAEEIDRSNEIFDYQSSVPFFRKWSQECYEASNGASLGNVRSMHSNVAAGKLVDIQFLDTEKAIDVSAKIVDPVEWEKCTSGVHTGFSIGGSYARKWTDVSTGRAVVRYTAVPQEISLVDRPAIASARFFSMTKRDGTTERRAFQTGASAMTDNLQKFIANNGAALAAVRAIHAKGSTPEDPLNRERVMKMRKRNPGKQHVDLAELARSIRLMRKAGVAFPPQSSNAYNDSVRADDGARLAGKSRSAVDDLLDDDDDDMDDEMYNAQGVTGLTGNAAMVAAQVAAVKRALKRAPKRMGGR